MKKQDYQSRRRFLVVSSILGLSAISMLLLTPFKMFGLAKDNAELKSNGGTDRPPSHGVVGMGIPLNS